MNPKAMGAALGVVAVVVIACVVLLGGDEQDSFPVSSPSPTASLGNGDSSSHPHVTATPNQGGSTGAASPSVPLDVDQPGNPNGPDGRPTANPTARPSASAVPQAGQGQLVIRCLDEEGNPLAGVNVSAHRASGAPLEAVITDGSGQAVLSGLPKGEEISGEARHALYHATVPFGPVRVGSNAELRFEQSPRGYLRGRIVDSNDQGVTDAELVLVDPKQAGESVLDPLAMGLGPDGSFWAQVAAGQYSVSARGPKLSPSDQTYVTVPADGEVQVGDLVVLGKGSLAGTVSLPPDLTAVLPVELVLVIEVIRGTESNPFTRVIRHPLNVDANMTWSLDECDPGRLRLRLELPQAGGNRVGAWDEVALKPGQHLDGIKLGLQEVVVAIQGTVTDDQSVPLEGAKVICGSRQVTTDRDGHYALRGLDMAEVFVEVHMDGHGVGFEKVNYRGTTVTKDFVLPRAGSARGQVLDADGNPAAGVPVQVVERLEDGSVRPHETNTDGTGTYQVDDLVPASYYVKAGPGNPWDDAGAPTIEVRPGEVIEVQPIRLR